MQQYQHHARSVKTIINNLKKPNEGSNSDYLEHNMYDNHANYSKQIRSNEKRQYESLDKIRNSVQEVHKKINFSSAHPDENRNSTMLQSNFSNHYQNSTTFNKNSF